MKVVAGEDTPQLIDIPAFKVDLRKIENPNIHEVVTPTTSPQS